MSPDTGSQTPHTHTVGRDPLSTSALAFLCTCGWTESFPLGILGPWSHLTATSLPSPKSGPNVGSLIINGNSSPMLVTFYK